MVVVAVEPQVMVILEIQEILAAQAQTEMRVMGDQTEILEMVVLVLLMEMRGIVDLQILEIQDHQEIREHQEILN
jgi:hypothetical protein